LNRSITTGAERFQSGAEKYATYLESPEGRLRLDLAFANLQEFLPKAAQPLRALDLGCGTGALGVRLAQRGFHVTLMDVSPEMLELARNASRTAGVTEKIAFTLADASKVAALFDPQSFDVILCHNVLEFVDAPLSVLRGVTRALRNSASIFSLLVRNQPGEVLKAALLTGDLAAAEQTLTSEWGDESLYGGKVRLFKTDDLRSMLEQASLAIDATRGVRILSDYLPAKISRTDNYAEIYELERKLGTRPDFTAVARYTQCLAHPIPHSKDAA